MDAEAFRELIARMGGNKSALARKLGVSRRTIVYWAKGGPPTKAVPLIREMIASDSGRSDPNRSNSSASPAIALALEKLWESARDQGVAPARIKSEILIWLHEKSHPERENEG